MRVALITLIFLSLIACDNYPKRLSQKAARRAVAGCSKDRIEFLAAKYRAQLVFDACGINNFRFFRWSPDGNQLFFQTPAGPFILDGRTRNIRVIPIPSPNDTPLWLDNKTLAFAHSPSIPTKPDRIDFFNISGDLWTPHKVKGFTKTRNLQPTGDPESFFFVADFDGKLGRIYEFFLSEKKKGKIVPAFTWIKGSLKGFSFNPEKNIIAYTLVGRDEVVLANGKTGEVAKIFPGAIRGLFSSDARWLLLEEPGKKTFLPTKNPANAPEMVPAFTPKKLVLWDLKKEKRSNLPGIWGTQAEWYPGFPQVSVILQAFDQTMLNPNILLVNVEMLLRDEILRKGPKKN